MKEAYPNDTTYLLTKIEQVAIDEVKVKKINRASRRGYPPNKRHHQTRISTEVIDPISNLQSKQMLNGLFSISDPTTVSYPWTTLGLIVKQSSSGIESLLTGTIIGENLVLTTQSDQLYPQDSSSAIWFIPFCRTKSQERYKLFKIFPPYKARTNELIDLSQHQHSIALLQFDKHSHLEQKYGSLGYSFALEDKQDHQKSIITASIMKTQEEKEELVIRKEKVNSHKNYFDYNSQNNCKTLKGSPILVKMYGQYHIYGVHSFYRHSQWFATKLNRKQYDKLQKFTFQGYQIDISHQNLTHQEIEHLRHISLKNVTSINLQTTARSQTILEKLKPPSSNQIQYINLSNIKLTDDQLDQFVKTPFKKLNEFYANKNKLTSQSMKLLSLKTNWLNLNKILISENPIGSKGLLYLSRNDWLLLERLEIDNCQIDNFGCQKLRKACFPSLTQLSLNKNKIRNEGVRWLLQADWKNLKYLGLSRNELQFEGLRSLLKGDWKKLQYLHIEKNKTRNVQNIKSKLKSVFKNISII